MPEIVFKGKEYVYNHHLTVPYPPGCHVRLASGELAVVVARGASITAPMVACLTNERGMPLPAPVRRETSDRKHAVMAVVGQASVNVRVPLERLIEALAA